MRRHFQFVDWLRGRSQLLPTVNCLLVQSTNVGEGGLRQASIGYYSKSLPLPLRMSGQTCCLSLLIR